MAFFKNLWTFLTETIFLKDERNYRNGLIRWGVRQYKLLFYTARGLDEHDTLVRSAALTFYTLMVDRSDRGARLRRGQGVRAGRRIDAEPLFALSAQPRGGRLPHHLRRQGARRRAGRRRRLRRDRHALLGRRAGLRLGRGGLQQYLGGEGLAQLHAAVHRLHRRGGHYADSVGRRAARRGAMPVICWGSTPSVRSTRCCRAPSRCWSSGRCSRSSMSWCPIRA